MAPDCIGGDSHGVVVEMPMPIISVSNLPLESQDLLPPVYTWAPIVTALVDREFLRERLAALHQDPLVPV
jgi:hypothetical protein